MLLNIVQNAVKFTKEGGFEVYLEFEKCKECDSEGCGVLITTVRDTGIGMDDDTLKHLF